jgi:protein SCO1/2
LTLALAPGRSAAATGGAGAVPTDAGLDQKPGARLPRDVDLVGEDGQIVSTGALFGRRPVVLTFVYFGCPNLCSLILKDLVTALAKIPASAGRDFDAVIVSIDPSEGPALAAATKTSLLAAYHRPGAGPGWRLLTGRAEQVRRLAAAAGVRYAYDEDGRQYRHPSALITVMPDGRVGRYLLGLGVKARDLRLALAEATALRVGTVSDRFLLLCYHYDAATGRYGPSVMSAVRVAGAAWAVALVWIIRRVRGTPARKREGLG